MRDIARYFVVGLLVSGMTIDATAANHWFYSSCCAPPCPSLCVEYCPPEPCCAPVDCCEETVVVEESKPVSPEPSPAASMPEEELATPEVESVPDEKADDLQEVSPQPSEPQSNEPQPTDPQPADPQPADDLLDAPADNVTPAADESDSLFETSEPVAEPDPIPAETPAADLFDAPAAEVFDEPAAVEEAPAEIEPLGDIVPPVEAAAEETPEPAPADSEGGFDLEEPAVSEEPEATEENTEAPEDKEPPSLDDLFGANQDQPVLSEPGGLASRAMRQWTDNGARFRCDARLQQVTSKTAILVKSNGKRIAVLFSRLSDNDMQFVQRQVVAQRQMLAEPAGDQQLASH